jgi:hypothetical protein
MGNQVNGLRLRRGRRAIPYSLVSLFRFPWDQGMFAHNHAILQLANDSWVAVGGMEGFAANQSCKRRHRRGWVVNRPSCLRVVNAARNASPSVVAKGENAIVAGVRVTRGRGWRWTESAWDEPQVFLRGFSPPGCIDRRPEYTGYNAFSVRCRE